MDYELYMKEALKEAEKALNKGEFPVGCVLVHNNEIITTGSRKGTVNQINNELDHAEIMALRNLTELESTKKIDRNRTIAFSTLEPCLMCFGALLINQIRTIIYAYEDVMGGGTGINLSSMPPLYSQNKITIKGGVLRKQSLNLMKEFFNSPQNKYLNNTFLAKYTINAS